MRIFPDWIKTTLKEDKEFYRCIIDALDSNPTNEQIEVLSLIKHHHLDKNRDLRNALFERFLTVLDELGAGFPLVSVNEKDQEAGSWWPIPKHGTTHNGQTHNERMAHRASKRQKMWAALVDASGFPPGEVDTILAHEDSQIGQIRDRILKELNDEIERLENRQDEMIEIMVELKDTNTIMQRQIETLEARVL